MVPSACLVHDHDNIILDMMANPLILAGRTSIMAQNIFWHFNLEEFRSNVLPVSQHLKEKLVLLRLQLYKCPRKNSH